MLLLKLLKEMKETEVVNLIKKKFPLTGDDSYWEKDGIAISVDSSVQGRHFLLTRDNWVEEGIWNAVAGSITDVSAVGSKPELILTSFCFPQNTKGSVIETALSSLEKVSDFFSLKVVGGDLSRTSKDIVFSVTVVGFNAVGPGLSCAKNGDLIGVTGYPGKRPLGWYLAINEISHEDDLIQDALKPKPNISFPLKISRMVSSMTDITDGLGFDLMNICSKSNVNADIYKNIPASPVMERLFIDLNLDKEDFYKQGGDYEYLFTFDEKYENEIKRISIKEEIPFSVIGRIGNGNLPNWYGKGSEIRWS